MSPWPNIIPLSRAVAALGLLSPSVFSIPFWMLYLWCGIIAALQLARMCFLYFRRGGWDGLHDRANKIIGLALYLAPLAFYIADIRKLS